MSKASTLVKNTTIITIGKISTQFITFLLLPFYTSFLSTEQYGIVDLFNTLVSLALPLLTLQIEQGLFRFLIDSRDNEKKSSTIIKTCIVSLIIQTIILTFIYILFSKFIDNSYKFYLFINIIVSIYSSIFMQMARGLGDTFGFTISSLIAGLATVILNIIFIAYFKLGAYGMLLSSFVANILVCIYLLIREAIFKYFLIGTIDINTLKKIIAYSIPLVPNSISWWIVNASGRTIISIFLGVSANGVYAVANKFASILMTIFNIFNLAWTESVVVNHKKLDFQQFFQQTVSIVFEFFSYAAIGMIIIIPICYNLLIDVAYSDAYNQIPILIIAMLINVVQGLYSTIYVAEKKSKELAKSTILGSVINIIINISIIKFVGLYATSFATLISYAGITVWRYVDITNRIDVKINLQTLIKVSVLLLVSIFNYYFKIINPFIFFVIIIVIILFFIKKYIHIIYENFIIYLKKGN